MARYSKEELDEEFEKFMKELSDESFENSNKTLRQPQKEVKKKDALPWWLTEDDLEDDRLLETNVSYVKTKRISQPLTDIEEESAERIQFLKSSGTSILSIDSLETNEIVSDLNHSVLGLGLDTLEEQEEKEQFFARLEKGLTSSIDYSRLNKELDYNDSTHFKDLQSSQANLKLTEELTEDKHESASKHEELSENYSDDFEHEDIDASSAAKDEEINSKENSEKINVPKQEEEKTGMLANVVLIDSLDSVGETNLADDKATTEPLTLPEITGNGMVGTALSYGQSSSDIEALHQAYHHIAHSLGDGGEERIGSTEMGNIKSLVKEHSQENEESSKNFSTTESDLPTVEELMRPIRIDSLGASHFDCKPVSYRKLAGSKETEFMSPFPREVDQNVASQEPRNVNQFSHRAEERVVLQKTTSEDKENSGPGESTMEERIDKTCLDILRKKISVAPSLLPQDNKGNKTFKSQLSSEEGAAADKQVPSKKARSAPPLLKRKPQSGLYASVRSSGYGKPSSPFKTFSALEKKASKEIMKSKNVRSIPTSNQARKKEIFSETKLIKPAAQNKPSPKNEVFLTLPMKSKDNTEVDSCGQFKNDSSDYQSGNKETELVLFKRVQDAEEKWRGAQALIEQIKVTFSEKERGLEDKMEELKRQQEKELLKLNQENYILQSKLNSFEETNRKQKWLHFEATDSITEEKLKHIQKEIQEQETLLQGYQQENERLYKQVKDLQEQNKKNEERMFKENQSLFSELASLKEQMHKSHFLSQVVEDSEPTGNQSFTDLLAELRLAQKEKSSLLEDIRRLKQDKQALEVDLEKMKKERDQAKDQIAYATGEKLYEIKILEDTHKQEVARLQKRLQWYAENQELLDKDAVRLKEAHEEIEKLKLEVEKLRTESGNPSVPQKMRLKDRAADARKIQDLERQVKEMEGILKRRHPNSLPALILAASAAGDTVERSTVEFMEKRIKKLEADLEGKDEEAKKSLRAMEQQFQKMKIQYEQRAEEQEKLLACKLKEASQHQCDDSRAKALEEELRELREAHRATVTNLEAEIDVLKHQSAKLELKNNDEENKGVQSIEFQVEQAHAKARLARLHEELAAKGREIQSLSKTVERLQKERREMLSRQNSKSREEAPSKSAKRDAPHPGRGRSHASSGTQSGRLYRPSTFTDSRLSEVLQENCRLKDELEGLILERNELQKKSETTVSQLENSIKRVKEDTTAHITSLKASHQREIEKLLCQNALENSSSKVAELNRKIASQEVLIKHFQSQVNELQEKQESLAVSQVREEILQKEITKLIEELKEAKENHTPEMKHFTGLEKKIKQMEIRHEQREQELQRIIQQTRQVVETEQNKEIEKWKRLAQLKNRELDHFRRELDSILDVLRELHQQGVVVPVAFADEISGPEYY